MAAQTDEGRKEEKKGVSTILKFAIMDMLYFHNQEKLTKAFGDLVESLNL